MRTVTEPSARLLELAAAQEGVLSRTQAVQFGLGRHVLQRLVVQGRWQRLAPGIFLTNNGDPSWPALAWAGVLHAGEGARLGGLAAAYRHGLIDEPPELIDILHPHGSRLKNTGRWRFHQERRDVRLAAATGSPPRTMIEDTVLDLAGTRLGGCDRRDAVHWLTTAVQRRLTTPERLLATLEVRGRIAERGELSQILADVSDGAQTPLEYHYLRDVERAHGLPQGKRQAPARTEGRRQWRDLRYEEFHLLVELDGQTGHTGSDRFRDYRRDNAALAAGDATLRYGWHDVRHQSCQVAGQVALLLAKGGWKGQPIRCPRCPPGIFG